MSTVYRAADQQLGRDVAVKVFLRDVTGAGGGQRHHEEVRMLASLAHPGLVTLFDADIQHEPPYFVMEYVDGETLADLLMRGPVDPAAVRSIGIGVADALGYVHARGLVHRDVKPGNILLPRHLTATSARTRLADFGIARLVDATRLTAAGTLLGTASYLSPEQARGAEVGPPADVYALGLVLLECLTGRRPFPGTPIETVAARTHRAPDVPLSIPDAWRAVLQGMTALDPADRPTAPEVVLRLSEAESVIPDTAREEVLPATRVLRPATASTADTSTQAMAAPELARPAAPAAAVTAQGDGARRRRRPVLIAAAVAVLALGGGAAAIAALNSAPSAPVAEYPAVDGTLGEHLEQLQRSVAP